MLISTSEVDYCDSNPCKNMGKCFTSHEHQSFKCQCKAGYTDSDCSASKYCTVSDKYILGLIDIKFPYMIKLFWTSL